MHSDASEGMSLYGDIKNKMRIEGANEKSLLLIFTVFLRIVTKIYDSRVNV